MQMPSSVDIPPYFPPLFWRLWFPPDVDQRARLHIYHVYDNELGEIEQQPQPSSSVFVHLFHNENGTPLRLSEDTQEMLERAGGIVSALEDDLLPHLNALRFHLRRYPPQASRAPQVTNTFSFPSNSLSKLRRYLTFIRFRNSAGYSTLIRRLHATPHHQGPGDPTIYSEAFRPYLIRTKRRCGPIARQQVCGIAEICVGVATDEQEYILPDCCYGALDEGFDEDREKCDFFFPISPAISVYLLGSSCFDDEPSFAPSEQPSSVSIHIGPESAIDVHLRNTMVLQTYPPYLIFSSLRGISLSVSSYYEFRWINEHQDYSRLRMRCRQKFMMEGVVKTLVIRESVESNGESQPPASPDSPVRMESPPGKDEVRVFDLTDEVQLKGNWAVAFGTFSDVWEGTWKDPIEKRDTAVAVKFLRQAMVKNVKERLIRRIQAEVATWHKLCHRNVSQFFGIVQSANSFGMVSPWYCNGIISEYVRKNPGVDRLKLLIQVASGIGHLHSFSPPIVHGDLKGGNILIDACGAAIITDFGLSKVMEETLTEVCEEDGGAVSGRGTSVFAGSTRWMAPELIMALVEDDDNGGPGPKITPMSDVYAFGSVCLEIATDELPYSHRRTDHAVTLDIIRVGRVKSKFRFSTPICMTIAPDSFKSMPTADCRISF
ncbi:TKL/TKL-ccin protein kinase [Coprinopsis cinerea AmutBmut pab1-1]|nr:TKL/TKL-ccin protein kinase [Coprinopsis cinerea AmutBmut pab1-1]